MRRAPIALASAAMMLVAGCAAVDPEFVPVPRGQPQPALTGAPDSDEARGALRPWGDPESIITGLNAPWSVVPLPVGSTLVSERDSARVLELTQEGEVRVVGTVPGVAPNGEGGLLGLAAHDEGTPYLYAYLTTGSDNRIVRFELLGTPGTYELGRSEEVLTGIPRSRVHNGGRLAFGPDGMLYATTGDASRPELAQDAGSLAGKILRLTPEGAVPDDNPTAGSFVYSLGHRNPQGIAFDANGQLWAAEFGQNTWDELNRIDPGANYGWPVVEGVGGGSGFVDPVQQWSTSEASPSGLGIVGDTLVLASLRGQRLWFVDIDDPSRSTAAYVGEFGRLRDALAGPDGRLWFLTNNTDGRGSPRAGDDHLYSVPLLPRD
jgi:glucose/arabinose dehydrogenase